MNKKELLLLSVCVFLTVIAWLIADLYNAATVEKIKEKVEVPTLKEYHINTDLLKVLRNKTE